MGERIIVEIRCDGLDCRNARRPSTFAHNCGWAPDRRAARAAARADGWRFASHPLLAFCPRCQALERWGDNVDAAASKLRATVSRP